MRDASPALLAFLASRQPCLKADLFTISLLDGTVLTWTDFDQSLSLGNTTWSAKGPLLARTSWSVKNTVEVPEMEIALGANDTDLINGKNIKTQIHNGIFDGARVELDRVFMPTAGDLSLGLVVLFVGRMSKAQITAVGATLTVKGDNVLMNQMVPRNVYQLTCLHTFCDPGCALNEDTYTDAYVIASASANFLNWTIAPPFAAALYNYGKATMISGIAAGQIRSINNTSGAGVQLVYPLYDIPQAGDIFYLLRGCDKAYTDTSGQSCGDFNNQIHFRGFPFVPPPQMAG
jgi:uncharacterized phage protein (TIGR02218 family)